ncbi:MAG: hypothetical protein ACYSWP_23250 [Planctomycetota bacterium]
MKIISPTGLGVRNDALETTQRDMDTTAPSEEPGSTWAWTSSVSTARM